MTHTSRRDLLRAGAAGTALAGLPLAAVHGQASAGRLAVGFWDHWVPAANVVMRAIVDDWARKNRVDVQIDFITSVGQKMLLTISAEAQAGQGHDILTVPTWYVAGFAEKLEPMDDLVARLVRQHGPVSEAVAYLGRIDGTWRAVPATAGNLYLPSVARIDLLKKHAGLDVQAMYPAADRLGPQAEDWTYETFLTAAETCNKAGHYFALPAGTFADATNWIGAMFAAFGAHLVDAKGTITVRNNDKVREVLDYAVRLFQHLPQEMFAADDATNNRALISGTSALIFNPPSAWAVAKRDAPRVAEQIWHFSSPKGPAGRFVPYNPQYWGIWGFSPNKPQAKALIEHLSQREQVAKLVAASDGYDIPPFVTLTDLDTWSLVGPPKGTVFNYPVKPHHKAEPSIAYAPAPYGMAVQMFNQGIEAKMIARLVQNREPVERVLAWAEREIEGFQRG
jgi:ABC-type glycerol-3-phosphate transport system substrate-binding protein